MPHTHNKKGVCEITTPSGPWNNAFQEVANQYLGYFNDSLSYIAGLGAAIATRNPAIGAAVQDVFSSIQNTLQGNPASPPYIPIDLINPPGAY